MAANEDNLLTDYERLLACKLVAEDVVYEQLVTAQKVIKQQNRTSEEEIYLFYYKKELQTLTDLVSLGWVVISNSDASKNYIGAVNGYKGLLLANIAKKCFLLVHRGMRCETANIANCLMIGRMEKPPIVNDALRMCERTIQIANKYPEYEIHHTGFSMGGFLAQITATYCNHNKGGRHNKAIGYDCPGAKFVIEAEPERYGNNKENVTVYLTDINLVNTATEHYGYVKQIIEYRVGAEYSNWPKEPIQFDLDNLSNSIRDEVLYVCHRTLETHKIEDILLLLNPHTPNIDFRKIFYWPIAQNTFYEKVSRASVTPSYSSRNSSTKFIPAVISASAYILDGMVRAKIKEIFNFLGEKKYSSVTHGLVNQEIIQDKEMRLVVHDFNVARRGNVNSATAEILSPPIVHPESPLRQGGLFANKSVNSAQKIVMEKETPQLRH